MRMQELADNSKQVKQLKQFAAMSAAPQPVRLTNETGLPDRLKAGIESLSGISMDGVRVHYNSDKPAQLSAHAYAQGTDIHVAPGQERHLPHEAWHVVQQAQGRVAPTLQMKSDVLVNDDAQLEAEADTMGARALQASGNRAPADRPRNALRASGGRPVIQGYGLTLAVMHPVTGRAVMMNRFDDTVGVYLYPHWDPLLEFFYDSSTGQFLNNQRQPMPAAPNFDEDAGPVNRVPRAKNRFRALKFYTDSENRVIRAKGQIHGNGTSPESGRSSDAQSGAWDHVQGIHRRMFMPYKEFNGGHIIAHHFGGSPGTDNMVPMEKKYNQNGSYKRFENALDDELADESPLTIDISVTYATDYNDLMAQLVKKDNANAVADIAARPDLQDIVLRTLGRIPKSIVINSLLNAANGDVKPANPDSPMSTLTGTIPKNFSLDTIKKTEFDKVGKGRDGDGSEKTFKPFEKSYGPKKSELVNNRKNYHADYQAIYRDMPKPGITQYFAGNHGLAGGVRAYIWMDPMGAFNRHGGSDTIDTVDPAGTNWNYFRKAVGSTNGSRIYKKGHLLNAGLHGPGADSRNLLPITTRANGEMSRNFEEPVKKSEALINPAKGVIWETRTSAALVTRPMNWDLNAATLQHSANLFAEEAKMPQYLDCFAWEAIQFEGSIEQGRMIASYRAWNKHPGDADGVLGITRAGATANDQGMHYKLPANRNNVQGHVPVVPIVAQNGGHQRGYRLDHAWLDLNVGSIDEFNRGVYEIGYDTGFSQPVPHDQTNWRPQVVAEYNEGYRKGAERFQFQSAFYSANYTPPGGMTPRLNERYDDGRYSRGKEIGRNLQAPPQGQPQADPITEGYKEGLYVRGKDDADKGQPPAHQSKQYQSGYWKAYRIKAFDHGYDLVPLPQLVSGFDASAYAKAYADGQSERGYDDGYDLEDRQPNQSLDYDAAYRDGMLERGDEDGYDGEGSATTDADYVEGYERGTHDREFDSGRDDAYDNKPKANHDQVYSEGYEAGTVERAYDEGYDLLAPTFNVHYGPFVTSYEKGVYERGDADGYKLRNPPNTVPPKYIDGYRNGLEDRGLRDGEKLIARANNSAEYLSGYDFGLFVRGEKDAADGNLVPASQEQEYLNGFD
jgi:hypothetical protein